MLPLVTMSISLVYILCKVNVLYWHSSSLSAISQQVEELQLIGWQRFLTEVIFPWSEWPSNLSKTYGYWKEWREIKSIVRLINFKCNARSHFGYISVEQLDITFVVQQGWFLGLYARLDPDKNVYYSLCPILTDEILHVSRRLLDIDTSIFGWIWVT